MSDPPSLRNSITSYLDHLQDVKWIETLVERHGVADVLGACARVLAKGDPSETHEVTTFLRDIGIYGIVSDGVVARVREAMPTGILPKLRLLLRSPVFEVRKAAIYTIGKLTFPAEAKALRSVFPLYVERDPFCLASLFFELSWLGDRRGVEARLKQTIRHKRYLIRWSALGFFDCAGADERFRRQCLDALSTDSNPYVAAEAQHQLARLDLERAGAKANWSPKADWRNKRRQLEEAQPSITFNMLELRFLNEPARRRKRDYSIAELDEFMRARWPPR